jgi:toxin ParE1/3/4
MASIIWTETALQDIESIAVFISRDSEFYAKQFVQKLIDATLKLEKFSGVGRPLRELPKSNYKEILFKKYRIIYRINSEMIYIISVHHSARLLENNDSFQDYFGE